MGNKILIVEDEYYTIEKLGELLKKDYEVNIAKTDSEALEYIKNNKYAVVLLDIMLPTGEGIKCPEEQVGVEVLKMLRETSPQTKVIVLTAVISRTLNEIKKYHPDELFFKPTDPKEIYNSIKKFAGGEGNNGD